MSTHIEDILLHSWLPSTVTLYGSGLLAYHIFCGKINVPEGQHAPIAHDLLAAFISNLIGRYTGSTISNYVSGLCAWHLLHCIQWNINQTELDLLLQSADHLSPTDPSPLRLPYTPHMVSLLAGGFNLTQPLDVAVFACLTTTFYACAHLGEFTVPSFSAFSKQFHVKPSDVHSEFD